MKYSIFEVENHWRKGASGWQHRCIFWKILVGGGGGKFSGFWGNYLRRDKIGQKSDKFGPKWAKIPLFSSKFPQNCQNFLQNPNIFQKLPKFLQNRPLDWDFLVKNCCFLYKIVGEIFGAPARTGEIIKFRGRIYSRVRPLHLGTSMTSTSILGELSQYVGIDRQLEHMSSSMAPTYILDIYQQLLTSKPPGRHFTTTKAPEDIHSYQLHPWLLPASWVNQALRHWRTT